MSSKCGTYAGWNQHQRGGTEICPPCSDAQVRYIRCYRIRTGRSSNQVVPVEVLRALLAVDAAREVLTSELGADIVEAISSAPKAPGEAA